MKVLSRGLPLCITLSMGPVTIVGQTLPKVYMETSVGTVVFEIDTVRAPITGANFLRYVDAGLYTPGRFYRTVTSDNQPDNEIKIAVIQGGVGRSEGQQSFDAIPLERTSVTGLTHQDGTLSMARAGVDSARGEFFICIGTQPHLDFGGQRNPDGQGFAAFGRVLEGMDVVRTIQAAPADAQRLTPIITIISAVRRPT